MGINGYILLFVRIYAIVNDQCFNYHLDVIPSKLKMLLSEELETFCRTWTLMKASTSIISIKTFRVLERLCQPELNGKLSKEWSFLSKQTLLVDNETTPGFSTQ